MYDEYISICASKKNSLINQPYMNKYISNDWLQSLNSAKYEQML